MEPRMPRVNALLHKRSGTYLSTMKSKRVLPRSVSPSCQSGSSPVRMCFVEKMDLIQRKQLETRVCCLHKILERDRNLLRLSDTGLVYARPGKKNTNETLSNQGKISETRNFLSSLIRRGDQPRYSCARLHARK